LKVVATLNGETELGAVSCIAWLGVVADCSKTFIVLNPPKTRRTGTDFLSVLLLDDVAGILDHRRIRDQNGGAKDSAVLVGGNPVNCALNVPSARLAIEQLERIACRKMRKWSRSSVFGYYADFSAHALNDEDVGNGLRFHAGWFASAHATPNENKMSDVGRERVSIEVEVWKSSQE
jgi:hypothetical protein